MQLPSHAGIEMIVPIWVAVAVLVTAAVAVGSDVATRKIPNWITGSALLLALLAHAVAGGMPRVLLACGGALLAGGLLLPGWFMGAMGAGDVKLMAAIGAWLAFPGALVATLASLVAGGIISMIVAIRHRSLGRALRGAAQLAASVTAGSPAQGGAMTPTGLRFPFAVAILAGSLIGLCVRL